MRILVITTACDRSRDCQVHLYEYFASKPDTEVTVIAPLYADVTKGATRALEYEEQGRLKIHRIYRDIPEMWSKPQVHIKEVEAIIAHLKPEIVWCWHQRNYPLAKYVRDRSRAEIVLLLEMTEDWIMKLAYQDKVPFILSCLLSDKYRELELTVHDTYFLKMEVPVDIPGHEDYSFERLNRGIFCGNLGYPYKGAEVFVKILPRLFEETPMERFSLISTGSPIPEQIMEQYGTKYRIDYMDSMPRFELFKEIAKSYFSFTTTIVESPGSFPVESWALKTPVFAAGCSLGETIIDLNSGVRSIESLKKIYENRTLYESIQREAYRRYREEFSAQSVGERCYRIFQAILTGKRQEIWEELRYAGNQECVETESLPGTFPQRRLKIGLQLPVINTFSGAVWGDEVMAFGLADALSELPEVEFAEVYDPVSIHDNLDIVINFYPFPQVRHIAGPEQFWWYQASISPGLRNHPDFIKLLTFYRGFFVAGPNLATDLMELGIPRKKIMFLPMSANSRFYRPVATQAKYAHNLVFCGNNHLGRARGTVERYLFSIKDMGLVIYGHGWDDIPELKGCCQGPIHPKEVPALYSSAKIVLSTHPQWHGLMDVPTSRLWEAAACGAFIISDKLPTARKLFGDTIVWTDGWDDLREKVGYYIEHEEERRQIAQNAYQLILSQYTFDHWASKVMEFIKDRFQEEQRNDPVINISCNQDKPLVSVIVPTRNGPEMLEKAMRSILAQNYPEIEIIVVNDGGEETEQMVSSLDKDHNITYIKYSQNHNLSVARNTALKLAQGKYIAYLDDDAIFYPHHLETLVNFLEGSFYKVAYTDALRAHQANEGNGYKIMRKDLPYSMDFSEELLLVQNISPVLCFMHEKWCLDQVGYFDETLTTHEDWDLWIRMSRKFKFAHIEKVTAEFFWRTDGTTMTSGKQSDSLRTLEIIYEKYKECTKNKPQIREAQKKFLASLKNEIDRSSNHIQCSIVIPVFNQVDYTKQCLKALIENTPDALYEVIIVDNGSADETREFLKCLEGDVKIITNEENLGFARACNQGAAVAAGKYIVFLNNDTIVQPAWLEEMVQLAESDDNIGIVGSKLLYPDGKIQHAGMVVAANKLPYHLYRGCTGDLVAANKQRDFQIVTAACLLIPKTLFFEVGGLDERYMNGYEDIDLCLKVKERGKRVVYNPKSVLIHFEGRSDNRGTKMDSNRKKVHLGTIRSAKNSYFCLCNDIGLPYIPASKGF